MLFLSNPLCSANNWSSEAMAASFADLGNGNGWIDPFQSYDVNQLCDEQDDESSFEGFPDSFQEKVFVNVENLGF